MQNISSNNLQPYSKWLRNSGVTNVTGWRWRKKRYIDTVNISGRLYITQQSIAEFHRRAAAGDFAKSKSGGVE